MLNSRSLREYYFLAKQTHCGKSCRVHIISERICGRPLLAVTKSYCRIEINKLRAFDVTFTNTQYFCRLNTFSTCRLALPVKSGGCVYEHHLGPSTLSFHTEHISLHNSLIIAAHVDQKPSYENSNVIIYSRLLICVYSCKF
jgi:hypothetical protein